MNQKLTAWRADRTLAYVIPFVAFMLLQPVKSLIKSDAVDSPWWLAHPEHWLYPLQTVICLALMAWWRSHYQFGPRTAKILLAGFILGVLGFLLWIAPGWIFQYYGGFGLPGWLQGLLGLESRYTDGFNPNIFKAGSMEYFSCLATRFLRLVVAVPLLEELFWRGWLWRYLADPLGRFWHLPLGVWHRLAFWGVIGLWAMVHQPPDRLACVGYGLLLGLLVIRTRSLWAAVVMHAITNLALGIYIMATGQWGYW